MAIIAIRISVSITCCQNGSNALVNHCLKLGISDRCGVSCTQVVQKSGIQCYNCKEYGHLSKECQKAKRAKDAAYQKEKMLLCKQEEVGVQLNAEQADWKDDTEENSFHTKDELERES
ncbi:gag-pol polyprotein [Tanacetum coccineum]